MWSKRILDYHFHLAPDIRLPQGIAWINPYTEEETRAAMRAFYSRFYHDGQPRRLILGINPGRFGAGTTGIPFTDPIRLEDPCGVANDFPKRQELSSVFVYETIGAYGGCRKFYGDFYISSLCPLGFLKENKNYNYYDDRELIRRIEPFIVRHLREQIAMGALTDRVICLGQGKNFQYLQKLNAEYQLFGTIVPLPHPRWVMQYRLKRKQEFIDQYLTEFNESPLTH